MPERQSAYADNLRKISAMELPEIRVRQNEIIARLAHEDDLDTEITQLAHEVDLELALELDLLDYMVFSGTRLIEHKAELDRHTWRRIIIGIASIGQTLLMGVLFAFGVKALEAYAAATLHLSVGGVAAASQAAVAVGSGYSAMYASLGLFQTIGIGMGLLLLGALAIQSLLKDRSVNILTILASLCPGSVLAIEPFNADRAPEGLRQFYKMVTIMDTPIPFKAMQHKLSDQVSRQLKKDLEFPGGEVYDRLPEDEAKWSVNRILNIVCGFGAPLCFALMPYWGGALLAFKIVIMLGIASSALPAILTIGLSMVLQMLSKGVHDHQDTQMKRGLSRSGDLTAKFRVTSAGMIDGVNNDLRTSLGQRYLEQLNQIYSTSGCKMLNEQYQEELRAKFEKTSEEGEAAIHALDKIDKKMEFRKGQPKGRESMHAVDVESVGAVDCDETDNPNPRRSPLSPVWSRAGSSESGSMSPTRDRDATLDFRATSKPLGSASPDGKIDFDIGEQGKEGSRLFVTLSSSFLNRGDRSLHPPPRKPIALTVVDRHSKELSPRQSGGGSLSPRG